MCARVCHFFASSPRPRLPPMHTGSKGTPPSNRFQEPSETATDKAKRPYTALRAPDRCNVGQLLRHLLPPQLQEYNLHSSGHGKLGLCPHVFQTVNNTANDSFGDLCPPTICEVDPTSLIHAKCSQMRPALGFASFGLSKPKLKTQ